MIFLNYDYTFLISVAVAQTLNLIAELVIHMGIPREEAKAEIEIHLVIKEAKIKKN